MKVSVHAPRHIRRLPAADEVFTCVSEEMTHHVEHLDATGDIDKLDLFFKDNKKELAEGHVSPRKPRKVTFKLQDAFYAGAEIFEWPRQQILGSIAAHESVHVVRLSNGLLVKRRLASGRVAQSCVEEGIAYLYQQQVDVAKGIDPGNTIAKEAAATDSNTERLSRIVTNVFHGGFWLELAHHDELKRIAKHYDHEVGRELVELSLGTDFEITPENVLMDFRAGIPERDLMSELRMHESFIFGARYFASLIDGGLPDDEPSGRQ